MIDEFNFELIPNQFQIMKDGFRIMEWCCGNTKDPQISKGKKTIKWGHVAIVNLGSDL